MRRLKRRGRVVAIFLLWGISSVAPSVPFTTVVISAQERREEQFESRYRVNFESLGELESDHPLNLTSQLFSHIISEGIGADSSGFTLLEQLKVIDPFELRLLHLYLDKENSPLSRESFYSMETLPKERLSAIAPLLNFESRAVKKRTIRGEILLRAASALQRKEGYGEIDPQLYQQNRESRYLGNSLLLNLQTRVEQKGLFKGTLIAEKDPGERGLDYIAGGVTFEKVPFLKTLTVGSFSARKGEGLILWSGSSFGGGGDPLNDIRGDYAISPYSSLNENLALRGIAATYERGGWEQTLLFSHRGIDARVVEGGYSSLLATGLHNTPSTLEGRRALKQSAVALTSSYRESHYKVEMVALFLKESLLYAGRDSARKVTSHRAGPYRGNIALNWKGSRGNLITFGEGALDICGRVALSTGVLIRGENNWLLSFVTNYKKIGFSAPLSAQTFKGGEGRVTLSSSFKKRFGYSRSIGSTIVIANGYLNSSLYWLGGREQWGELNLYLSSNLNRLLLRCDYRYNLTEQLLLYSRVQGAKGFGHSSHYGVHAHQELQFTTIANTITIIGRVGYFKVTDWGSRLYSYERDLLYQFRTEMLYGEAFRSYLNLVIKINRSISFRAKYGSTYYLDRTVIGSGKEQIDGRRKSELKGEFIFRF